MSERCRENTSPIAIQPTLHIPLNHKGLSLYLSSAKPQGDYSTGGVDGFYSRCFAHLQISCLGSEAWYLKKANIFGALSADFCRLNGAPIRRQEGRGVAFRS